MIELKEFAAKTSQGPFLEVNEDDYEVDILNKLFLIFDGFGGSNIGDRTVRKLKDSIKSFYTKIGNDSDATLPFFYSYKYLIEGNALINSMHYAHMVLKKENYAKKNMAEMGGASAICASLAENILTLISTGNCLSYLYRKGHLAVVTFPDNLKQLTKYEYSSHFHSCPISGFGLFDDIHLQIREMCLQNDDLIILMTDGAYGRMAKEELKYVIEKKNDDQKKIDDIFTLVNGRGNLDNQSVIFLRF